MAAGDKKYDRQRGSKSNIAYKATNRHQKNKDAAIKKHRQEQADHTPHIAARAIDGKPFRGTARMLRRKGMKAGSKVVNTIKEQIILPIRAALMNAKVMPSVVDTQLARTCIRTLQGNSGLVHMGKGWNASLSLKTYQKLKDQGIMV